MALNLTPRKTEICKYLIKGLRNEEIAEILNVSRHTIKAYVSSILYDTKVRNRTELAYMLGKENFMTTDF